MKILHICTSFNVGGTETMLVDIMNEQSKTEPIYFIIINNIYNEHIYNKISGNVKKIKISRNPGSKNVLDFIKFNFFLRKINPDIIHCHEIDIVNYVIKKRKWQLFLTVHDTGYLSASLYKYDRIISISKSVQYSLIERQQINSLVIYNGIQIEKVSLKTKYDFDVFKILCISRLDHQKKGQDLLIKALNKLIHENKVNNIELCFIGQGKSLSYLQELVKRYNLHKSVTFLGLKNREYIYKHIKDYNLLVQPSIYEGFGLTVVEGMAAKVPVLVTDIEGPMEIIENGRYGFSFSAGSYEDLGEKILEIMNIYRLKEMTEFVNNSYLYIYDKFSISNTANNYLSEYKKSLPKLQ